MSTWTVLQLSGIFIEIVAGFILSLHALGLERVNRWSLLLTKAVEEIWSKEVRLEKGSRLSKGLREPGFLFSLMCTFVATSVVAFFLNHPPAWAESMQHDLWVWVCALGAGFLSIALMITVIYATRSLVHFLIWANKVAVAGTAGVIGFVVLLLGFLLQFLGTLGQAIWK